MLTKKDLLFSPRLAIFLAICFPISPTFSQTKDSLSTKDHHQIDSATRTITHKIDSLRALGLPSHAYQKKLDSTNVAWQKKLSTKQVNEGIKEENAAINKDIKASTDSVSVGLRKQTTAAQLAVSNKTRRLDSIARASNMAPLNLPSKAGTPQLLPNQNLQGVSLPNVNTSGVNLPNTSGELNNINKDVALPTQEITKLNSGLPNIESAAKKELNSTEALKDVSELRKDEKEIAVLNKKTGKYKKDLKDIQGGDKEKIDKLETDGEKQAEKSASNLSEVKEIKKEESALKAPKNAFQQYDEMIENLKKGNVPDVRKISTTSLPNPFIGQEAKVQAAIGELNKLKKKYKSFPDSRYLPKHVPNEMKGRPFKERFIPGLAFQGYSGSLPGIEVSTYFMYRVSGRLRLGAGASDRFLVDSKKWNVSPARVQAVRTMLDFRFLPNLYFHVEEEWTHFAKGNIYQSAADAAVDKWINRLNMGPLRTYKISKRLNGQYQLLYNTLDWTNFPQAKNTSIRFGLELKLK